MTAIHYCLSSISYKNKIFAGFSQLQKDEELVDLTLAADGCFVKVHRNIMALASPYLRQILRTLSDHSPVIFLHNVSEKILSYLLEFIYQGAVNIPVESVDEFIEVSKSLHVAGIENLEPPKELPLYKLTAMKKKQQEKRTKNIVPHTVGNNRLDVEEYPQTNNCNVGNYENINELSNASNTDINQINTDTSLMNPVQEIDNRTNSDDNWINNAQIIIQQPNNTEIIDQINMETEYNIPVIDITADTEKSRKHTDTISKAKDFKIILTSQDNAKSSTDPATQNIPTIVIQPLELSNEQNHNTFARNMALQGSTNATIPLPVEPVPGQIAEISQLPIQIMDDQILKTNKKLKRKSRGNSAANNTECIANKPTITHTTEVCKTLESIGMNELKNIAQYSMSERGALQLILNRYIYCCHHSAQGVRKRRWRCTDYRHKGCKAIVDTFDEDIVARKGVHDHAYHDSKINKKNKKNLIYRTMLQALDAVSRFDAIKLVSGDEID